MIRHLFKPVTPAEELRAEREKIARKSPALSLVKPDPRPDPRMWEWHSVAELIEGARR